MPELRFSLLDAASFDLIPLPARPDARCQTCDYWERLDGSRQTDDSAPARDLKRSRLLAGERLAGAYAMLALDGDSVIGYAQFGPLANYPRAQVIRDRYRDLPESPAPWVVTCLQVMPDAPEREAGASALLGAVCDDLDRRGIVAVEAYPEVAPDPWLPSAGPEPIYLATGFERVAGDDRYPVLRRELTGGEEVGWGDLLARTAPPADDDDAWPLPEKPTRPNPFGDD
ncbi:MAG: hypothetical protein ABI534_04355 [Chloroflexota bacterium]